MCGSWKRAFGLVVAVFLVQWGPPSAGRAQQIAKYAGEFLSVGAGARALGMGGAYTAVAEGSIASYWNPAGLMQSTYPEIHLMHAQRFAGVVKYNYAALLWPLRKESTFGFGLMRMGIDDIPITALLNPDLPVGAIFEDENGQPVRNVPYVVKKVSDVEYALYFSYARRLDRLPWQKRVGQDEEAARASVGASVKMIRKGVGDNSAWGIGFDVALLMPVYRELRLGVNFQDVLTTLLVWDTGRKELISPTAKVGAAWPVTWGRFRVVPALDADVRFEGRKFASQAHLGAISLDFHAGIEAVYRNVAFLRLGSDVGRFTAGAGIQLPRLRFDAAFLNHQDLGNTYRISATLTLEEEKFRRK